MSNLANTLGNTEWLRHNEAAIRAALPDTWTHAENINGLQLGYRLKLIGIDWRSPDEFGRVMVAFEKLGLLLRRNGYQVRANPTTPVFK